MLRSINLNPLLPLLLLHVCRRLVSNATLFAELVQAARSADSAELHMGGNAPLMARRFALEGCEVLLGAHMSAKLRSELPPGITVAGPEVAHDEVHLLLEYPAGERWGHLHSPRANRRVDASLLVAPGEGRGRLPAISSA